MWTGVCEGKRGFPLADSTLPGLALFLRLVRRVLVGSVLQAAVGGGGVGAQVFFFFFSPNNPAQVSAGAQCPVSSAPSSSSSSSHPVSLSARRRRFWFWIEGPSCRSGARASHWRSWAFSWAGSAQRRRVERAPCTWPLGRDKCCKELRRGKDKGQSRQDNVEEKTESPDTGLLDQMMV